MNTISLCLFLASLGFPPWDTVFPSEVIIMENEVATCRDYRLPRHYHD
jgi:hypothetical protein